jgi:hypothetical protein
MIEVVLNGGLGNQMFQYAAGRALSLRLNMPLSIDTTILDNGLIKKGYTKRNYELDIFENLAGVRTNHVHLPLGYGYNYFKVAQYKGYTSYQERILGAVIFDESSVTMLTSSGEIPSKIILKGYFQSEDFFQDAIKQIRKEFKFSYKANDINSSIIHQLKTTQSVSLHVRRTDYLSTLHSANYPVCGLNYYRTAINYFKGHLESPLFYIFSDDINWAAENLPLNSDEVSFISHNTGKLSFEDMRLMSHAKHHIIANSSFSWWGAWLNEEKSKVVISPKNWTVSENITSLGAIVPALWLKF